MSDEVYAGLTPKGVALCDQIKAEALDAWKGVLAVLSDEEIRSVDLDVAEKYFRWGFWYGRLAKGVK